MQHVSCNMSLAKSKSKPDKSKSKLLPPLTVYYTNVRGLRGNFTDLEAFMLKNNPDIFALCETNLHGGIQDSDFQLPGYLPKMLGTIIISISTIGMRLLKIRKYFVILVITVRVLKESSKRQGPIMLKQPITMLHLSLSNLVTSGRLATSFLRGGSLPPFNGPKVLTISTDKFYRQFHPL